MQGRVRQGKAGRVNTHTQKKKRLISCPCHENDKMKEGVVRKKTTKKTNMSTQKHTVKTHAHSFFIFQGQRGKIWI